MINLIEIRECDRTCQKCAKYCQSVTLNKCKKCTSIKPEVSCVSSGAFLHLLSCYNINLVKFGAYLHSFCHLSSHSPDFRCTFALHLGKSGEMLGLRCTFARNYSKYGKSHITNGIFGYANCARNNFILPAN